jgi:hypothetical protein
MNLEIPIPPERRLARTVFAVLALAGLALAGAWNARRDPLFSSGASFLVPRAGEGALSPKVREVCALIRDNSLKTYRLSASLAAEDITYQRITEAAWLDARLEPDSPWLFVAAGEAAAHDAGAVRAKGKYVELLAAR